VRPSLQGAGAGKDKGFVPASMTEVNRMNGQTAHGERDNQEIKQFMELRRKVRDAELLSSSVVKLLFDTRFTGKLMVIVQNGRVLKSGYEEGYFRKME
jgi:hypothetical protein